MWTSVICRLLLFLIGTTLFKGQRVEAISNRGRMSGGSMGGMMGGGTIDASEIDWSNKGSV